MIKELYQFRNLINELVKRDIKKKYRRSVLGYLWSMLNPLLMMLITAMVFSHLFRFDIPNYPLYLQTGQIIFTFYSEATNFAMGSILENGGLIKKVYVPKYLFPLSRVISSGVNVCFTLPAMVAIMLFTGAEFHFKLLVCVIPLLLLMLFSLGIGLLLAAFAVYFRDIFHLYGVLLTVLNYATPIFYPTKIIPPEYQGIVLYNPLTYFLQAFRDIVYGNVFPSGEQLLVCTCLAFGSLLVGGYAFSKKQNNFVLYV